MKLLISLLGAVLLAACAPPQTQELRSGPAAAPLIATPIPAPAPATAPAPLPAVELTPDLLYRFLLAEIAGQRGLMGDAAALHLEVARETRDPRVARRAAEIALHGRRMDVAIDAARLWLETDPASPLAHQTLIGLLAGMGRFDELEQRLAALLAGEPDHVAGNLFHLNRLLGRATDRQAARQLVDRVTEPYLGHSEAHFVRATAAHEAGDAAAAQLAIRRALELRPDWEAAALARLRMTADPQAALAGLGDFVAANPHAREARLTYARLLAGERRYAEARREFRALLAQGGEDAAHRRDIVFAIAILSLQLDDSAEAERLLRPLAEGGRDADQARLHLGQIAAAGQRWDEALAWYAQVGSGEHYMTALLQRVLVLAQQERIDAARELLAAARAEQPRERVRLWLAEAQLLRERNDTAGAHALLAAALDSEPDHPDLLYETALLAERLGRIDELETRLRRLIELRPDHAHAHNALGYSLADRNLRLDEARKLIERALELAPNDPFILDSQGWVLFRLSDRQGALDYLQRAYAQRTDPEIAAHLGEVLWVLGRQDDARAVWDKARREHPANEVLAETIKRFLP